MGVSKWFSHPGERCFSTHVPYRALGKSCVVCSPATRDEDVLGYTRAKSQSWPPGCGVLHLP